MNGKTGILVGGIVGLLAVSGFILSTNYSDREDITSDFKSTTDGSYFLKHLFVNVDAAEAAAEELKQAGESGEVTAKVALSGTPGKMQGLWSKADGSNVTADEFEQHCQQTYGTYWDGFREYVGVDMQNLWTNPVVVQYDQWKGKFGDDIGLIHYSQSASATAWGPFNQNVTKGGSATISGSGCGPTALSAIFSTMLHKYITPLEVVAARDTMYLRMGQSKGFNFGMWSDGTSGAMLQSSPLVCDFVRNQKYNGESVFECTLENLVQSRVDETLDKGGMVLLVPHGIARNGTAIGEYWTGKGHYIAVRARDGDGNYYTVDGSHDSTSRPQGNHDVPHPWSDIEGCGYTRGAVHYVTPGPGYDAYAASLRSQSKSGSGSSSTGGSVESVQSADTQKILAMTDEEVWSYLTDGQYNSYDAVNQAWHSNEAAVRQMFEQYKTEITVPVWAWADAAKTSKVATTMNIKVHKKMTEFFKDFMTDLHNLPEQYVIISCGGFEIRSKNNRSGSGNISGHSFGCTLDINAYAARGMGSLGAPQGGAAINTPIASQASLNEIEKSEACTLDSSWYKLACKYQLNWGGNWSDGSKDPMHFSLVGDGKKNSFSTEKKGTKWQ